MENERVVSIKECLDCPFHIERGFRDRCTARKVTGRLLPEFRRRPPSWCLLREGPVTLRLEGV